jgi:hypothetical protein
MDVDTHADRGSKQHPGAHGSGSPKDRRPARAKRMNGCRKSYEVVETGVLLLDETLQRKVVVNGDTAITNLVRAVGAKSSWRDKRPV